VASATNPDMQWYVLGLNAEPWRVGPLGVGRTKAKKLFPYVGRDQQLYAYQEAVKMGLNHLYPNAPLLPEVEVELVFYFHHVLEEYETASGRKTRDNEADLTNLVKATEDAIQGVLIRNDRLVMKQTNYLRRTDADGATPYIVIGVAPYAGENPDEFPDEVWQAADILALEQKRDQVPNLLPDQEVF